MHKKADIWTRSERWAWHFPDGVLKRIPLSDNNPAPFWMFITTESSLPYEAHFILNSCNCCKCTFHIEPSSAFYYFCSLVPVFSSGANGQRLIFLPCKSFLYLKIDIMFSFKSSLFHVEKREMDKVSSCVPWEADLRLSWWTGGNALEINSMKGREDWAGVGRERNTGETQY